MKKIKLAIAVLVVGVLCGCLGVGNVSADTIKNSLTVSPPNKSILLTPGETYKGSIKVSSQASSDTPTYYEVSVGPFSETRGEGSKDDYGNINYINSSSYNQIVDWIKIDDPEGVVQPNETNIVSFTIDVPENAPAGGQYASLIVKDTSSKDSVGDGVAVQNVMQILSILYAEVAGETKDTGEISMNSMPSFLLNGPLVAESMVRNTGNVHTDAQYTFQVWPLFSDEEICTNAEEPELSLVMPETERYHSQTCELPSVGIFKAKQTVKIFGEESTLEKVVIICPIWLLFIILLAIVAIIIWLVMQVKKRKNGKSRTSETSE